MSLDEKNKDNREWKLDRIIQRQPQLEKQVSTLWGFMVFSIAMAVLSIIVSVIMLM